MIKSGTVRIKCLRRIIWILLACTILSGLGLVVQKALRETKSRELFEIFLRREDIHAIAFDGDRVWAGGAGGLYLLTPETKNGLVSQKQEKEEVHYRTEAIGRYRFVKAILAENNRVWIGHEEGLTLIENTSIRHFTQDDGLPDKRVNALYKDSKGFLWIGTWNGLTVMEGMNLQKTYTTADGLAHDMVNVLMEDSTGSIWCGSYVAPRGGISVLKNQRWTSFTTGKGLLHSNINAIIELKSGRIMAGGGLFTKGGATIFIPSADGWEISGYLRENDGIAGAKVRSLLEDSRHRLWVGSEYDGLAVFDSVDERKAPIIIHSGIGLPNDEVKVIAEDPDQNIWVGTMSGLVKIEKGGIENVR